jgi:hypothetical protein
MPERDREDLEEGLKDTEIRRDTQVRGSLGIPPSGRSRDNSPGQQEEGGRAQDEQMEDDDRMSER